MFGDVISALFSYDHDGMWTYSFNIISSKIFVFEGLMVVGLFLRPQEIVMIG